MKGWKDDLNTQKLVPVLKFGWSALISYTGVARTPQGKDVGEWIAEEIDKIEMYADFDELPIRLLAADAWLSKKKGDRRLAFSVVGFVGRRPIAMVISNFTNLDEDIFDPVLPQLSKDVIKPKVPEVRVAGDSTAVSRAERENLKGMVAKNCSLMEVHEALAKVNVEAANRSSKISRECVVGILLPTGKALVQPYAIDNRMEYMPDFVKRDLSRAGIAGFKRKVDQSGNPLSLGWEKMVAKVQGGRIGERAAMGIHEIRGAEVPIAGKKPDRPDADFYSAWKIAGENESLSGITWQWQKPKGGTGSITL